MPLRLNLLAEAQAEEELRRRDPVKRGILVAVVLVSLMVFWICLLQIKIMGQKSWLAELESRQARQAKDYQEITRNEKNLADLSRKLDELERLSTNRFLWGSLLNALQKSTVPDVRLISFRSEQTHLVTEEIRPKTNDVGKITIGKPGVCVEKIRLQFDARDASPTPGDQVGKFKEVLASSAYFRRLLGKTNEITLRNLSAPALDSESGKTVVMFTLECRVPDKTPK